MRKNDIKGLIHDLLNLGDYRSPLQMFFIQNKFEINLLKGKINYIREDSLNDFYREKYDWFKERIKKLNGNLNDFDKAKIIVFGKKEKIEIIYKGENFYLETVFRRNKFPFMGLKRKIKNLKNGEGFTVYDNEIIEF